MSLSIFNGLVHMIGGFFLFSIVLAMFSDTDTSTPSESSNTGNSGNSASSNANEATIVEAIEESPEPSPEPELTLENIDDASYEYVEYDTLLRGGYDWIGKKIVFEGTVSQVLYDTGMSEAVFETFNEGTFCNIWLDTNQISPEQKLVVGLYVVPEGQERFLEGDYVTLYGTFDGLEQFEMVYGPPESFPVIDVDLACFSVG